MIKNIDEYVEQTLNPMVNVFKRRLDTLTGPTGAIDAMKRDAYLRRLDTELKSLQALVNSMRARVANTAFLAHIKNDRGYVAVICVLLMPVLIGFMGLTIDTALLMLNRAQASRAADAIALGAAADLYGHDLPQPAGVSGQVQQVAQALADANDATLTAITCGHWQNDTFIAGEPEIPDFSVSCSEIVTDGMFMNACRATVQISYTGMLHSGQQTKTAIAAVQLEDSESGGCNVQPGSRLVQ